MFRRKWLTGIITFLFLLSCFLAGCGAKPQTQGSTSTKELTGKVIIFHAGSLTEPLKKMAEEFEAKHPGVKIELEASGSRAAAKKITELHKPCDILASADYEVIEELLRPNYIDNNILFARNELVIAYTSKSKYASEINSSNWYQILLRPGVNYGRSDENADPCGYRTLMCWQLAAKYYRDPGLYEKLNRGCPLRNIRPKAVELLAMLESGALDYAFEYKSVAEQHKLRYVTLPPQINLGDIKYADFYKQATVQVKGSEPGKTVTYKGTPIVYGVTLLKDAPNKEAAVAFLKYMLAKDGGLRILQEMGQPVLDPPLYLGTLPPELAGVAQPAQMNK
ncbi:extracellular solute-binding protein family 1 [Ammonifex degensii KC4]|uniref:Extracellular solute-binding protein family 1 n=1 Tax=Ammonifex degensii (strain DSM 10501 / KC4) TaxID=429009 RepID=C9RC10_AMMDK|nr:tungstate ABC transporter substrate-binding protein WtpA [Ammonifex degensii]ACX51787.1 extracellular solute-binding protein family 1 [Ammonifex degensii KC4]